MVVVVVAVAVPDQLWPTVRFESVVHLLPALALVLSVMYLTLVLRPSLFRVLC